MKKTNDEDVKAMLLTLEKDNEKLLNRLKKRDCKIDEQKEEMDNLQKQLKSQQKKIDEQQEKMDKQQEKMDEQQKKLSEQEKELKKNDVQSVTLNKRQKQ